MRDVAPAIDTVAALCERLAVLLSAGVSPVAAWGYLDAPANSTAAAVVAAAAEAARQGRSVASAIARVVQPRAPTQAAEALAPEGSLRRMAVSHRRGSSRTSRDLRASRSSRTAAARIVEPEAWLALAAAWQVATDAGAPLAPSLRDFAQAFRQLGTIERERALALAAPAATARLVLALPVIGVVFGTLLGFDTLRTLFATIPGWICIVLAAGLLAVASWWTRTLIRRARPRDKTPGLLLELMAVAMEGGGSIERARAVVDGATRRLKLDRAGEHRRIAGVLDLAERAGVPAAELLRSEGSAERRSADAAGRRRAMELSVSLMLPLGLCVLPAFLIVGVVPLLITVITSTMGVI